MSAKGVVFILQWAIPWEIPSHLRHTSWSSQLFFLLLLPVSVAECSSMVSQCIHKAINSGLTVYPSPEQAAQANCLDCECIGVRQMSTHTDIHTQREGRMLHEKNVKEWRVPVCSLVLLFLYIRKVESVLFTMEKILPVNTVVSRTVISHENHLLYTTTSIKTHKKNLSVCKHLFLKRSKIAH